MLTPLEREENEFILKCINGEDFKPLRERLNKELKRELNNSIANLVMPSVNVVHEDLDRAVDSEKEMIVVDRDPSSHLYTARPDGVEKNYVRGSRYKVIFEVDTTPIFLKDVDELKAMARSFSLLALFRAHMRELVETHNSKFIKTCDLLINPETKYITGSMGGGFEQGCNNYTIVDALGITRDSISQLRKSTVSNYLDPVAVVCDAVTMEDVLRFSRDATYNKGNTPVKLCPGNSVGCKWVPVFGDVIPRDTFYVFTEPQYLGKHFNLEGPQSRIWREAFVLNWVFYNKSGLTLANDLGLAKCRITTEAV